MSAVRVIASWRERRTPVLVSHTSLEPIRWREYLMMRRSRVRDLCPALVLVCPVLAYAGQNESGPTAIPCREPLSTFRNGLFNFGEGPVRLKDGRGCVK